MSKEAELKRCVEEMKESMEILRDLNSYLINENTELKRKLNGLEKVIITLVENGRE